MNHVFIIHSGITLEVAKQIIQFKGLKNEDCIFLISRFFPENLNKNIKTIYLDKIFNKNSFQVTIFVLTPLLNSIKLNRLINKKLTCNTFEVYLPHHALNIYSIISNNKRCKKISYLEEGTLSYTPIKKILPTLINKPPSLFASILFMICFIGKVKRQKKIFQLSSKKPVHFYSISKLCFPDIPVTKKTILLSPFHKNIKTENTFKNIIVIEPFIELSMMSEKDYFLCLMKILNHFNENKIHEFHFKFHPKQSNKIKLLIKNIFTTKQLHSIEINENLIIEEILDTDKPNIYHINSSVGIYSIILNCKTYSLYNYATSLSHDFRRKSNGILDQFKAKTIFLE